MASGIINRESCYATGDTYCTKAGVVLYIPGIITSSTTRFFGSFNVEKSLAAITSVTITSLIGSMRGINGYVDSTSDSTNLKTKYPNISFEILDNYALTISINKGSTAFSNVSNNTPVILCCKMELAFS